MITALSLRRPLDDAAVWAPKNRTAAMLVFDSEAALVHEPVVATAEQEQVRQLRLAAVRPVLDVVGVDESALGAAGKATAAVAGA